MPKGRERCEICDSEDMIKVPLNFGKKHAWRCNKCGHTNGIDIEIKRDKKLLFDSL